jgi:tetratricopeptide (TPR) repeat protein
MKLLASSCSGVWLVLALLQEAVAQSPRASIEPVDAHAEVAAVLYSASATQAALTRSLDAQLRSQHDRINALAAEIKAGNTAHRADMTAAQDSFVAELAAKDRQYAAQIALFRNAVTDIASTPDGASALERFNAGDEIAAIAILDRIHAANERMRETRAKLEDAAEGRRISQLAFEARSRGKLTTQAVIARYEEVVRLDPDDPDDWQVLCGLYTEAARLSDARRAVDTLMTVARNDADRAAGYTLKADVLEARGDLVGARAAALQAIEANQRVVAAEPGNVTVFYLLARSLMAFNEVAITQGDLAAAKKTIVDLTAATRPRVAADPANVRIRNLLSADLLHWADVALKEGDSLAARKALEESIAILRRLAADDPSNNLFQRESDVTLMWLTDVLVSQGDFNEARSASAEIVATATKLCASDPMNAVFKRDLAYGYLKIADLNRIEGDFGASVEMYEKALTIMRELVLADSGSLARLDVGTTLQNVADIKLLQRDYEGARHLYEQSADALRAYAAADKTDVGSRQDLAESLYGLGEALAASADYRGARKAYEEGLALDHALLAKAPDSAGIQLDLSTADLRMGELANLQGNHAAALPSLLRSLEIRRRIAAAHPGSSSQARDLAEVMRVLADTPGSKLGWPEFSAQIESMARAGILWPADHAWLEDARRHVPARETP